MQKVLPTTTIVGGVLHGEFQNWYLAGNVEVYVMWTRLGLVLFTILVADTHIL